MGYSTTKPVSFGIKEAIIINKKTNKQFGKPIEILQSGSFTVETAQVENKGGRTTSAWHTRSGETTAEVTLALTEDLDYLYEVMTGDKPKKITSKINTKNITGTLPIEITEITGGKLVAGTYILEATSTNKVSIFAQGLTDLDVLDDFGKLKEVTVSSTDVSVTELGIKVKLSATTSTLTTGDQLELKIYDSLDGYIAEVNTINAPEVGLVLKDMDNNTIEIPYAQAGTKPENFTQSEFGAMELKFKVLQKNNQPLYKKYKA